ncbi:MAG: IclR family transcriptional regulator [Pseudomonadota bacterium]
MATVKSADRVVQILEAVASRNEGLTHGEIARKQEIPKGSLSLLLSNLVDREYLALDPQSKLYVLGPQLLVLTGRYLNSLDIVQLGRPIVHTLVREINEDAEIVIRKGDQVLFLYKEESARPVRYAIEAGELAPLYATSPGKCILAFVPEEDVSGYLQRVPLSPITEHSITAGEKLFRELEMIRSRGIAYGQEEYRQGICGVAAPIFNIHGNIAGALVATLEAVRFKGEHRHFIEAKLRGAALELSRRLGFPGAG